MDVNPAFVLIYRWLCVMYEGDCDDVFVVRVICGVYVQIIRVHTTNGVVIDGLVVEKG